MPAPEDLFEAWEISPAVNRVANDYPGLLEPVRKDAPAATVERSGGRRAGRCAAQARAQAQEGRPAIVVVLIGFDCRAAPPHCYKQALELILRGARLWLTPKTGSTSARPTSCRKRPLQQRRANNRDFAVSFKDGRFGVVSNACNHVGGPLGEGRLDGDYIICPWHNWKFHRCTGKGEPGFEEDAVPSYPVKVENGRVLVDLAAATKRTQQAASRRIRSRARSSARRAAAGRRHFDHRDGRGQHPRFSGSDHLLDTRSRPRPTHGAETRLIRLNELKFRACEGYYSKAARACTWPCSITQMDDKRPDGPRLRGAGALGRRGDRRLADPLGRGLLALFQDGGAAQLRAERRSRSRNQVLIRNKVAGFIIVGGQDNIQGVAGQMLGFFAELGFIFPQFPYIAHSRGWSREDMERNVEIVRTSTELAEGAGELAQALPRPRRAI